LFVDAAMCAISGVLALVLWRAGGWICSDGLSSEARLLSLKMTFTCAGVWE
jgi:hypothetical protein